MPAYLVRIEQTRDIVGFFFADTMEELLDAVDECTEADGCEYVEMPVGGLMWTSPAIPVPIDHGSDDLVEETTQTRNWSSYLGDVLNYRDRGGACFTATQMKSGHRFSRTSAAA
jgi:hypothetical protein